MSNLKPEWPKHPDGRNKRMGEMTRDERRSQVAASVARVMSEPAIQSALVETFAPTAEEQKP